MRGVGAGERAAEREEGGDAGGPGPAERVRGARGGGADPGGAPVHAGVADGPAQDVGGGEDAGGRRAGRALGGVAEGGGGPAGGGAGPAKQRLDRRLHLQPPGGGAVRPEVTGKKEQNRLLIDKLQTAPRFRIFSSLLYMMTDR